MAPKLTLYLMPGSSSMAPHIALHEVGADHVAAAVELGPLLDRLVREEVPEEAPVPDETLRKEVAAVERAVEEPPVVGARPSSWPCPDCNGVLWEIDDDDVMHVLDETPDEEHRGELTAATASCPVLALSLEG